MTRDPIPSVLAAEACEPAERAARFAAPAVEAAAMLGASHVIFHVAFCAALERAKAQTQVAMRVHMVSRYGDPIDKQVRFVRGTEDETVVELDAQPATYRITIAVPAFNCAASDLALFLADHDRTIGETLQDGPPQLPTPVLLIYGTTPRSFQYARPTFVHLDPATACNAPVGAPLAAPIDVENERDAYYVNVHFDPAAPPPPPVLALRLRMPAGAYHYVRVKIPFANQWSGWPSTVQFDVTEDAVDDLATQKIDTLLCPKLFETIIHE